MATTDIFQDPFKDNPTGLLSSQAVTPSEASPPQPDTTTTTTANQDFTSGNLELKSDGAYFTPTATPKEPGTDPMETVEGRLSGLLASESPYLTAAKTRAKQEANARGLLNSTMAATAGEKAAIETALPIAQQDAQSLANYRQNIALQKNQGEIQKVLYETQGDISSRLSTQTHEQEMIKQAADIEWKKIDLQARMDVEFERLDQENKQMFNDTIDAISTDYMNDYMEIMVNPALNNKAARQAALDILAHNTKQRYALAGGVAAVELTWDVPDPATVLAEAKTKVKANDKAQAQANKAQKEPQDKQAATSTATPALLSRFPQLETSGVLTEEQRKYIESRIRN